MVKERKKIGQGIIHFADFLVMGKPAPNNSRTVFDVSADSLFGKGGFMDYSAKYASKSFDKFKENDNEIKTFNSFADYSSRFSKLDGASELPDNYTVSSDGILLPKSKERAAFIEKAKKALSPNGQIFYRSVISIRDYETADAYGLRNVDDWATYIQDVLPKWFKETGFDNNNMMWMMDFHPIKEKGQLQPHIHLSYWEINQTRTNGKLTGKQVSNLKHLFGNKCLDVAYPKQEMFMQIDSDKEYVKSIISEYVDLNNIKSIKELYDVLPTTGRMQINSENIAPYKDAVMKCVDDLLNDPEVKDVYDSFVSRLDQVTDWNYEVFGDIRDGNFKNYEIKRLKERLANYILNRGKTIYLKENSYKLLKEEFEKIKQANKSAKYPNGFVSRKDRAMVFKKHWHNKSYFFRGMRKTIAKQQHEVDEAAEKGLISLIGGYKW